MATKGVISIADGIAHKIVYISGQMPVSYDGELLMNSSDPAKSSIAGQTTQCINNILAILRAAKPEHAEPKPEITDIIRTTVYLTDMKNFNEMNDAYAKAFGGHKPARTTIGVKELPKGIPVEIEAIGVV